MGCSLFPRSRFDEARQSIPEIRAYTLDNLPDLTPQERETVQTGEPKMGQANFVTYYFWWQTSEGKTFATVVASPPPCKPFSVSRPDRR